MEPRLLLITNRKWHAFTVSDEMEIIDFGWFWRVITHYANRAISRIGGGDGTIR